MSILTIKDLSSSYGKTKVLHNFNLEVEAGSWVAIVGPNGSGKSTLVKILAGLEKFSGEITVDGTKLNDKNIMQLRSKIGFVFDNPEKMFVGETVRDDIAFGLENLNISKHEINRRIEHVAKLLKIEEILDIQPQRLSGGEKQKVALATVLVMELKILILDDALSMIDPIEQKEMLRILKTLHKETELTIITVTCDLEEVLFADQLTVIEYGVKVVEGPVLEVLKEEHIFRDLSMRLPFMVDFSLKLKDYELIDEVVLDMKELVHQLWQ